MDFQSLTYYKTICENLSFRKAAELLHVSQPSLSAGIRKLEEEMDVVLLHRDNKGVRITPEGAVFYREVCDILQKLSQAQDRMRDLKQDQARHLNIAFPSTSGAWLWPELLEGFARENPNIELTFQDISSYDVLKGVMNDELELGYAVLDVIGKEDKELSTKVLFEDEVKLMVNVEDELAREEIIDIHELEGRRVAMYHQGTSFCEKAFRSLLDEHDIHTDFFYLRQQSSVFNLVAQGLSLGVILDDIELISHNDQICLRSLKPSIPYRAGFLWKKNRYLSNSAKSLLDYFG